MPPTMPTDCGQRNSCFSCSAYTVLSRSTPSTTGRRRSTPRPPSAAAPSKWLATLRSALQHVRCLAWLHSARYNGEGMVPHCHILCARQQLQGCELTNHTARGEECSGAQVRVDTRGAPAAVEGQNGEAGHRASGGQVRDCAAERIRPHPAPRYQAILGAGAAERVDGKRRGWLCAVMEEADDALDVCQCVAGAIAQPTNTVHHHCLRATMRCAVYYTVVSTATYVIWTRHI